MSKEVIAFVEQALEAGLGVALVTLTESGVGTPGVPGSMMALSADGSRAGTVGGGAAEALVLGDCRAALEDGGSPVRAFAHNLGDGSTDMICGGEMKGYINVLRPASRLVIFGGGHVGQKLYQVGLAAGFAVTVVEERPEYAPLFPQAKVVIGGDFGQAARELPLNRGCYGVVVTRGHAQDYAVLSALVGRELGYLGMIGSRKKVGALLERLATEGATREEIDRIYTPIGLDLDDGTPGELAVAILAEILAVKNGRPLRHCRERMRPC